MLPCTISWKKIIKPWIFKTVSKIFKALHVNYFFKHKTIFKSFDLGVATWMQCCTDEINWNHNVIELDYYFGITAT